MSKTTDIVAPRGKPAGPRILAKITKDAETGCWLWQGYTHPSGYGAISAGRRGLRSPVHRVSYETFVGPIPDGLQIDHLCRVRNCVNPEHLEPVTAAENNRRARQVRMPAGTDPNKDCCIRGHEFTPENTRVDKKGRRGCLICNNSYQVGQLKSVRIPTPMYRAMSTQAKAEGITLAAALRGAIDLYLDRQEAS